MRILFLSFYFEPDLCAGSFRNSPLVEKMLEIFPDHAEIIVITSQPNRYKSYKIEALEYEDRGRVKIHRIKIDAHNSGMKDQAKSFYQYYKSALKLSKSYSFDMVYASSSRLFTAYLGSKIAKKRNVPFYVDVRDIFVDTMDNLLTNGFIKLGVIPFLKYLEGKTFRRANHINLISEGFHNYFVKKFPKPTYSFFSHGIDNVFLNHAQENPVKEKEQDSFQIVYAGNIGEGQGLDKVIPQVAKSLGGTFQFHIYGDGGAKHKFTEKIGELGVKNVIIHNPIGRKELLKVYENSDFLFLHLNSYKAFEKVLPSKLFEYAAYNVPIIAGVDGYARDFITKNLENIILFEPCNHKELSDLLQAYTYQRKERTRFKAKFKRDAINEEMAKSILKLVQP